MVRKAEKAEYDFHARFDASWEGISLFCTAWRRKRIRLRAIINFTLPYPLNIERMREAASYLIGTHDFTSFCSAKTEVVDRVRTIKEIEMIEEGELLVFRFSGNGFLYNMVRILSRNTAGGWPRAAKS